MREAVGVQHADALALRHLQRRERLVDARQRAQELERLDAAAAARAASPRGEPADQHGVGGLTALSSS